MTSEEVERRLREEFPDLVEVRVRRKSPSIGDVHVSESVAVSAKDWDTAYRMTRAALREVSGE